MSRDRDAWETTYRAHLRAMTTARQDAEQRRSQARTRGAAERRAADHAYKGEIARLAAEHQAWMHAHLPAADLPDERHQPRFRWTRSLE